jgi:hypothetical protein
MRSLRVRLWQQHSHKNHSQRERERGGGTLIWVYDKPARRQTQKTEGGGGTASLCSVMTPFVLFSVLSTRVVSGQKDV